MSCSRPNLLAIPRDPAFRRCIVPRSGQVLVVADYSAIDLRVLAEVTQDAELVRVFRDGADPHAATAAALLGKPVTAITKDERARAKAVNFGFAFGMGPSKFVEYALANYGVSITGAEAAAARDTFLSKYAGVAAWQRKTRSNMPLELRTILGRRRTFSNQETEYCERLNTPVQGTAADGFKLAMVLLHERLRETGARIVLAVHDELVVETPAERADDVRDLVENAMVEAMSRFVRCVPVAVESSVRRNWADSITE
jgi:DNA polymerase-1